MSSPPIGPDLSAALETLKTRFGHKTLYPLQEHVIRRLLGRQNALVVMPTGSGKSLCYQLPALTLPGPGLSLVFSPLIALMQDQVSALRTRGIHAEYINSTLERPERRRRYQALSQGAYEIVYVTPERMQKDDFRAAVATREGGVKLLAVDEAHCITKWGHDFRPAYGRVGEFRDQLGRPPTVALTATATPTVRADIRRTLGLDAESMPLFASDIDRPNLTFEVEEVWTPDQKLDRLLGVLSSVRGTVIVYFVLIKNLDEIATEVRRRQPSARLEIYHGQLPASEKKRVYDRFAAAAADERLVLLATNAFGMGVDKPDIRAIVHAQVPGSVEAYYQEVGRAGRDGKPSRCLLLYDPSDLAIQQEFIDWMNPSADLLLDASRAFQCAPNGMLTVDELRETITGRNRGDRRAEYCLITLNNRGAIEPHADGAHYAFVRPLDPDEVSPQEIAEKRERDLLRLLDVTRMLRSEDIRKFVTNYFDLSGDA